MYLHVNMFIWKSIVNAHVFCTLLHKWVQEMATEVILHDAICIDHKNGVRYWECYSPVHNVIHLCSLLLTSIW